MVAPRDLRVLSNFARHDYVTSNDSSSVYTAESGSWRRFALVSQSHERPQRIVGGQLQRTDATAYAYH